MMKINANTRISALLREHPDALETIVSLSPKFAKLRNPLLRKLMASRTTIRMASKIGGCAPEYFINKLAALGFQAEHLAEDEEMEAPAPLPVFMQQLTASTTLELDVRPILNSGKDPFKTIMGAVSALHTGQTLKLINGFEPIPLIQLLGKQGFECCNLVMDGNTHHTFFHRLGATPALEARPSGTNEDFDAKVKLFESHTRVIDVRDLEMPLPMLTILDELEKLPAGQALYVHHKRIPVFLLPELEERNFAYRTKEVDGGNVKLFIFRP